MKNTMYNIMDTYQRNPDKFIEDFGTIAAFMTKNNIEVFVLEKVETENSYGIRIGIDAPDKTTLLANPPCFEKALDPNNVDEISDRTVPEGLWKMYLNRDTILITLTNVNSVKYFTAIDYVDIKECDSAIGFHNYIRDSEMGYRSNGIILTFTIDGDKFDELRKIGIDETSMFSFIRIYLLTWFSCQPNLCPI